jgi:lipopolysaccharide transport system permease protein
MLGHNIAKRFGAEHIVTQRRLLVNLTMREIQSRYRGTVLGLGWAVAYPLLMMSVYTFVFGMVFNSRWSNTGSIGEFAVMLFSGLIIFSVFSEAANRAPSVITGNPNFVKKVIFPLEILPLVPLGAALINAAISFCLLCLMILLVHSGLPATALLAPLILLPLVLMVAGVSWVLAALGVFFRDIGQVIGITTSMMLFLSPVFFPISSAPTIAQALLRLNPLSYPIEEMRKVLILGVLPDWTGFALYFAFSIAVALGGLWIFQRSRPAFADVL